MRCCASEVGKAYVSAANTSVATGGITVLIFSVYCWPNSLAGDLTRYLSRDTAVICLALGWANSRLCSMAVERPAMVGLSNKVLNGRSIVNALRKREITWVAKSD